MGKVSETGDDSIFAYKPRVVDTVVECVEFILHLSEKVAYAT